MLIPVYSLQHDMEPNNALESTELLKLDENIKYYIIGNHSQINEP